MALTPATINNYVPGTTPSLLFKVTSWCLVTFLKESSDAIVIGSSTQLKASPGGNGIFLQTGAPLTTLFAPGSEVWGIGGTVSASLGVHIQSLDGISAVLGLGSTVANQSAAHPAGPRSGGYKYPGEPGFLDSFKNKVNP